MVGEVRFELTNFLFPKQGPSQLGHSPMVGKESIELSSSGFSDQRSDLISYNPKLYFILSRQDSSLNTYSFHCVPGSAQEFNTSTN